MEDLPGVVRSCDGYRPGVRCRTAVKEMIMLARGEQGRVWRLDTETSAGRREGSSRSVCRSSRRGDHRAAAEALIESPTNLQSCHRDLQADNILPIPTGGVCVIDWENCGLADPAQELPMVMIDFASGDRTGSPSCTCRTWRLAAPLGSAATARSRW